MATSVTERKFWIEFLTSGLTKAIDTLRDKKAKQIAAAGEEAVRQLYEDAGAGEEYAALKALDVEITKLEAKLSKVRENSRDVDSRADGKIKQALNLDGTWVVNNRISKTRADAMASAVPEIVKMEEQKRSIEVTLMAATSGEDLMKSVRALAKTLGVGMPS